MVHKAWGIIVGQRTTPLEKSPIAKIAAPRDTVQYNIAGSGERSRGVIRVS